MILISVSVYFSHISPSLLPERSGTVILFDNISREQLALREIFGGKLAKHYSMGLQNGIGCDFRVSDGFARL